MAHNHYSCRRINRYEEDQEYVGLCLKLPSLSRLAPTPTEAMDGISKLVQKVLDDMSQTGETPPESSPDRRR